MEDILKLAKPRSDQAEVFRVSRIDVPVTFEANRLKLLQTKEASGLALRIVKNGRIGLSATNDPQDIPGLVDRAVELAGFGAEAHFELPGPQTYPQVAQYDEAVERVPVEQMVQLGQSMIDAVRGVNNELVCGARVYWSVVTVEIRNSNGGQASYKKSMFGCSVDGTLIRGTDMLFVGDYQASSRPILDPRPVIDTVVEQLELARETVPAPSGQVPVIFTPGGVGGAILGPLIVAFNGKTVLQGSSPLVGKLGQKLFDERLSIWDDPLMAYQPGSRNVDDEGVPARRFPLIEDGRVGSFYYDLQTAGLAGAQSTGSASRALGSLPYPATSLLVIKPGQTRFKDMVAGIKDGLVIEDLLGAGQGNILGGEFGGNVLLGYRIENGKIIGRVKNTVISGNVYTAFKNLLAIGSEPRWIGGSLFAPHVCCEGITVSTKS